LSDLLSKQLNNEQCMSIGTPSARLLFLPGLTFALTWTFFPAIQLELDNNLLFPIAFGQAVFVFLALALALACLLVVIFSSCNDRCREIAALALMGFAAVGWIKGHIFEWDHTIFDGKSVDWNVHRFENAADFALYTLVALLAVVWRKRLIVNRNTFCAFICLAQLSNLVLISPLFSAESVGELLAKQTRHKRKNCGNLTCPCRFPPVEVRVRPSEGRTDEASQVYGRADYTSAARA
jgi:hypothetical protein